MSSASSYLPPAPFPVYYTHNAWALARWLCLRTVDEFVKVGEYDLSAFYIGLVDGQCLDHPESRSVSTLIIEVLYPREYRECVISLRACDPSARRVYWEVVEDVEIPAGEVKMATTGLDAEGYCQVVSMGFEDLARL